MIDKTKKRSFFARIACGIFAVSLAFCAVSMALFKPVENVSAFSSSDLYMFDNVIRLYDDFAFVPKVYLEGSSYYFGIVELSPNDIDHQELGFDNNYNYNYFYADWNYDGDSTATFLFYLTYQSDNGSYPVPVLSNPNISYYQDNSLLSTVLALIDDSYYDDVFSDGSYILRFTFIDLESDIPIDFYIFLPVNEYTSSFTLDQQTVTESVTVVWTSIFSWLTTSVNSLLSILYVNGELTILGVLVVMSLGISIFFLLLAVVSNFFHLRN